MLYKNNFHLFLFFYISNIHSVNAELLYKNLDYSQTNPIIMIMEINHQSKEIMLTSINESIIAASGVIQLSSNAMIGKGVSCCCPLENKNLIGLL